MAWTLGPITTIPIGGGPITQVDVSDDGKLVAVAIGLGGNGAKVRVYDTQTKKPVIETAVMAQQAFGVAFTDGGRRLHFLSWDSRQNNVLSVLELPNGRPEALEQWTIGEMRAHGLARDPSGTHLVLSGSKLRVLRAASGDELYAIDNCDRDEDCVASFSADGKSLWVHGLVPGEISRLAVGSWKSQATIAGPPRAGGVITTSRDGRYLSVTGRAAGGIAVYDLSTGTRLKGDGWDIYPFTDEESPSRPLAFAPSSDAAVLLAPTRVTFDLPAIPQPNDDESSPIPLYPNGDWVSAAAMSFKSPLVAVGSYKTGTVRWFEFVPT